MSSRRDGHRRSPRIRIRVWVIAGLALWLAANEGVLRLLGAGPWDPRPVNARVEPGGSFAELHPTLGFGYRPGEFRVSQESLRWTATHGEDGLRITDRLGDGRPGPRRPELWIMGGSFTYGWAVNDWETFPWLLQEGLPQYRVVNFGVGGYGTLQSLIQLEHAVAERKPALVVVAYASYHDPRNVFSRQWRKKLVPWNRLENLRVPRASLGPGGELQTEMTDATYRELPGMRLFAIVHLVERVLNRLERVWLDEDDVTFVILERMAEIARREQFDIVLAGLGPDRATRAMLDRCRARDWTVIDISHDWADPNLKNEPWDDHPNAAGQRLYAADVERGLRTAGFADR
jgi:hypothetical protein